MIEMLRMSSLLYVCLVIAQPLFAQTTAKGSLRGAARDEHGAVLPGVTVSATTTGLPPQIATTDRTGQYRISDLAPGDYRVVGELTGFAQFLQPSVTILAGLNVSLDFVMTVGAITEIVEVKQDTPLLESQNAVQSVNVSGELLRGMPLSERREWFGALALSPGVTTSQWANNETLVFVHGADSSNNIVQIDGADMSPSIMSGVKFINLNTDSVDDIQIKTAGLDASAPLGVGGIINIATVSGTNQPRGAATMFLQPRAWNGSNSPGGTSSTVDQRLIDLSLGGPLVKDHLWSYGSYRQIDLNSGVNRTATQLTALQTLVPGWIPLDSTNNAHYGFVKITGQRSAAHRLEGFYQYDVNPITFIQPTAEYPRKETTGGSGASVRLSSLWSDHVTTRLGVSFNDKRDDGHDPQIAGPVELVYQSTISSAGRLLGNGSIAFLGSPVTAWNAQPDSKLTLSFDSTVLANGGWGSHELQMGLYAQPHTRIGLTTSYINSGFVLEELTLRTPGVYSSGLVPFHRLSVDGNQLTNADLAGQDYAFYVQDAWRPAPRLTINAGVRIDRIVWNDRLFNVTSERSTAIGPRFGINYGLTSDDRNVLRAHWVRVHEQPSQSSISVGSASLAQRDQYDLNLDGTFETTFLTPATLTLTPGRTIDPSFHQPFVQEWGAGYERQFAGRLTTAVDLVHRDYRDRPTLLETNGMYTGNVFVGYADANFNQIYELTNNRWNTPVYTSFEFAVTKRTSRLQGIASYVRQWRHLAGTWQPNDPASFIQPSAFEDNKGIGSPSGSTSTTDSANSLSGMNMTGSAQWQDHVARVGVVYTTPWRVLLASNYTFQSGAWSGPIVSRIAAPDPAFGPTTVTLSNGRRVTNPLATTLRFTYPARGDGQLTTPMLQVWNVRVGYDFAIRRVKLNTALDVFNLTNNGSDEAFLSGSNQTYNPLYGSTTYRQLPRSAQVMIRAAF
jgi:hypothetical protein